MNGIAAVTLPGGMWFEGVRHQEAGLRFLTGEDEAVLTEIRGSLIPARRTSLILGRCLTRLGPFSPVPAEMAGALSVGDREALLLHLRRLTLGERMQCVLACPAPGCGAKMDLELSVSALLQPPYADAPEQHEVTVSENGDSFRVRFRLPTGADQEVAAGTARRDLPAAAGLVLNRCVVEVTRHPDGGPLDSLPPAVVSALPEIMAGLDPQAETRLDLKCPDCGRGFSTVFDMADFFFRELAGLSENLYREVHLLAFYYHWSETEIMNMTARKRRRYLYLLEEALSEERNR
ncbi:MAG: hypothetical protein WBM17_15510 [Anaerolineales bacterium]